MTERKRRGNTEFPPRGIAAAAEAKNAPPGRFFDASAVEICSKCHPFYTGKQKLVDTSGRVEKFNKKFGLQ